MDRLQAMLVFTRVVESGSFSKAAETLDLSRPSVTVIIQNLESYLKIRLLQRSTRRLNLTPDGQLFYERCGRVLADVGEMEDSLTQRAQGPVGRLRVETPASLGKIIIIPAIENFRIRYPGIELSVGFGEKSTDLIHDGVDCVLRLGALIDSNLVAKKVGSLRLITVAAPAYLQQFGMPSTLNILRKHTGVRYLQSGALRNPDLTFRVDGQTIDVNLRSSISINDAEGYLACGLSGLGLIQSPHFMAMPYLKTGKLIEIFPQWEPMPTPISAVYVKTPHPSHTVRAFVDWVSEVFEASLGSSAGGRLQNSPRGTLERSTMQQ
jgi:LysR family transcriptional regulator for bpeEF and oprC